MSVSESKLLTENGFFAERCLRPAGHFSPTLKSSSVIFLNTICSDIQRHSQIVRDWQTPVFQYAELLMMNDLEITAWNCVLMRVANPHDSSMTLMNNLKMTAFYSKFQLCRVMDRFENLLSAEDPAFPKQYTEWLHQHLHIGKLTLEEINRKYKRTLNSSVKISQYEDLNSIVDAIVQATFCTDEPALEQEEEELRKVSKRHESCVSEDTWVDPMTSQIPSLSDMPGMQLRSNDVLKEEESDELGFPDAFPYI